jgi:acyl-CoA thioesterase YciA
MATSSAAGSWRRSISPARCDLLSFYADIVKVGNTSITVNVEVYAERNRLQACIVKVTEATLIYVATDSDRKPRKVPPIETLLST